MDKSNKTLLLFTGEFPYGKKGEPFLEDEILFLSKEYSNIYVFPRKKSDVIRYLPTNVQIIDDLAINSLKIIKQPIIIILKSLSNILFEALKTHKGYKYLIRLRHFLYIRLEAQILKNELINWLFANSINNALAYFYWSDSSLLAFSLLKKKDYVQKAICRAHRFDLYDANNFGGLIPFRLTMYERVDAVYCISSHGRNYLLRNTPQRIHSKIKLAYLGVKASKIAAPEKTLSSPIIVSCARMETFKRIGMIPDVLKLINMPLKWVHFGDGPEFEQVKEKIKSLPETIQVTLMGQTTNSQVHRFYQNNPVSLFLSLSTSEGLPVSMMEAISYGIPIMATGINGVPEIVTEKTGILLKPDESTENIADKIVNVITANPFNRSEIVDFYRTHFNAETNYANFAKEISNLL